MSGFERYRTVSASQLLPGDRISQSICPAGKVVARRVERLVLEAELSGDAYWVQVRVREGLATFKIDYPAGYAVELLQSGVDEQLRPPGRAAPGQPPAGRHWCPSDCGRSVPEGAWACYRCLIRLPASLMRTLDDLTGRTDRRNALGAARGHALQWWRANPPEDQVEVALETVGAPT